MPNEWVRGCHDDFVKDGLLCARFLLLIGGETRGITRSIVRAADLRVSIPYGRPFAHALGTATAAAALAFEVLRQRQSG